MCSVAVGREIGERGSGRGEGGMGKDGERGRGRK